MSSTASPQPAPEISHLHAQLTHAASDPNGPSSLLALAHNFLNSRALALLDSDGAICQHGQWDEIALQAARARVSEKAVAQRFPENSGLYLLVIPVHGREGKKQWFVAWLGISQARDIPAFLVLLQALSGFLLFGEEVRAERRTEWALEKLSALLDIHRRIAEACDYSISRRIAVDGVAKLLSARVVLGLRRGRRVTVEAVSGVAGVDSQSPAHQGVEAAMEESLEVGRSLRWSKGEAVGAESLAQELWAREGGWSEVQTIPLMQLGAVSFAWAQPPARESIALREAVTAVAPALFSQVLRGRGIPWLSTFRRRWEKLSGPRRRLGLVCAGSAAILLAWPLRYRIKVECRLAPRTQRVIAAPFEGKVSESWVRRGDRVAAGDRLAELERRDLKVQEAELQAQLQKAEKQRDRALRNEGEGADVASAQIADFEARSVAEELGLVRRKIELLRLTAPIAGVVISGDLERAIGAPVKQGDVLFEVAPLNELLLEIDVPDREMSRVRRGQMVDFRLSAFSGGHWKTRIERVYPQSEQRDGQNVFVAEGAVSSGQTQLEFRPGMVGRAVIESDRRSLLWILGHRFWDWLTVSLFW